MCRPSQNKINFTINQWHFKSFKFLKYFNGTIISTLSILPLLPVLPVIFVLKLNESVALAPIKLTIASLSSTVGTSLKYCHKLPDVFE